MTPPSVAAGREALERGDWQTAYAVLSAMVELDADGLDALADAAWWLGRIDECIEAREQAYSVFEEAGEARRAARCAVLLFEHFGFKARPAIAGAWLRRAHNVLGDDERSIEFGDVMLREVELAHAAGELDVAVEKAQRAIDLGRDLRARDLEAQGLQAMGRLLIVGGRPAEGLAYYDEAMLFAVEGKLSPYATGKVYCSLISACDELGDLRRAAEWTDATARWSERHPLAVFPGMCRVHRAGVLRWRGAWPEAEEEALRACAELAEMNLPFAAAGYDEIGDIRRRLGDLEGAEESFRRAEGLAGGPRPGVALLRLAQGRPDEAAAMIDRALAEAGWNRLARGKLLPGKIQIALVARDIELAAGAAEELEAIAADFDSPLLSASAVSARGRLLLATGDAAGACETLRRAVKLWQDLGVPYEGATARLLLGQACREIGDEGGASASFASAAETFERLGAVLDARRTHDLRHGAPLPGGLTEREAEVLRLVASGKGNKEVAAALSLAEKTIARHLSNIFVKIGVSSRSAATAYAFEHRMVGPHE